MPGMRDEGRHPVAGVTSIGGMRAVQSARLPDGRSQYADRARSQHRIDGLSQEIPSAAVGAIPRDPSAGEIAGALDKPTRPLPGAAEADLRNAMRLTKWFTRKEEQPSKAAEVVELKQPTTTTDPLVAQLYGSRQEKRDMPFEIGEINQLRLRVLALEAAVKALHYEHATSNKVRRRYLEYLDGVEQMLLDGDQDVAYIREARAIARRLLPEFKDVP